MLSAWAGSGFVKVNLRPTDWPSPDSPARYLADLAPQLVTGEPVVFSELLRLGVRLQPRAMVSTSLALPAPLRADLERHFGCPVLDWYSMVETGPIACSCPAGNGLHVFPHDVLVEALSADGAPAAPGERGEITVSGGRNPFLPLLRYRTGDFGRLDHAPCPCGDPTPRIVDLDGRPIIVFRASDGTPVGPVDISRALRELPILRHAFVQHADGSCELTVQPRPGAQAPDVSEIAAATMCASSAPCRVQSTCRQTSPPASRHFEVSCQWGGDMTKESASIPIAQSYPIKDDDLGSLPGYLGSRRIQRSANSGGVSTGADTREAPPQPCPQAAGSK